MKWLEEGADYFSRDGHEGLSEEELFDPISEK